MPLFGVLPIDYDDLTLAALRRRNRSLNSCGAYGPPNCTTRRSRSSLPLAVRGSADTVWTALGTACGASARGTSRAAPARSRAR